MSKIENKLEIDDRLMDELVSGELRGDKYRQVLLAIEERPQLWRACALAFLREQAIQQDLKALAQGSVDWQRERTPMTKPSSIVQLPAAQVVAAGDGSGGWQFGNRKAVLQRFAALAALLLVSFSVGWLGAGLQIDATGSGGLIDSNNAGLIPGPVVSNHKPVPSASSPTIYPTEPLQFVGMEVPQELIDLERSGRVRIEVYEALMPVTLDDGGSAVVPIFEYRVEPVAHAY